MGNAVDTTNIREIRGADLRQRVRTGNGTPLGITERNALIGILIPVTQAWVEHVIDYNWSQVRQSIDEGEQALKEGAPMVTLDDALDQAKPVLDEERRQGMPEMMYAPLVAAVVGGTVMQAPETRKVLERLNMVLNPSGAGEHQDAPPVLTMRIGELTAGRIKQVGGSGHIVALTHDRELVGIVIPVTERLVEFLVEQNISRILYNVGLGEMQLTAGGAMITLDQALGEDGPSAPEAAPPSRQTPEPEGPSSPEQRTSGRVAHSGC